jgi:cellulose synthase/poly-beta-1,6-N-acetylglucosamine synthase-like glycosyltransferase
MSREETQPRLLPIVVVVAGLLAGWAVLSGSQALARRFNLFLYLLANLVVFIDLFDFLVRLHFRKIHAAVDSAGRLLGTSVAIDAGRYTPYQRRAHLRPFALAVSVFNAEDYIDDFLEAMQPYREKLWIIDDGSSDNTRRRISQGGWRVVAGGENRRKPGAIQRLLEALPPEVETVVVLDPDIVFRNAHDRALPDLETVIFEFQRSGMAACCPRIAIRPDGLLARFQGLEYCMSFSLGRMSLADSGINSGISMYRRDALATAFRKHSLSVYAEDLENSAILLGAGELIYHDARLVVETEGKRTWGSWFSQRVGWAYGLIKVYGERFADIRRVAGRRWSTAYHFVIYMGVFSLLLHPLRLVSVALLALSGAKAVDMAFALGVVPDWSAAEPAYFLAAFVKYTLLSLAALLAAVPRGERTYLLPVVPLYLLYSLAQVAPTTVGYANWLSLRLCGRRLWGDHYQDADSLLQQHKERVLARAALP